MDQQLSYKLSLDIVDLKRKAKEAQAEIDRIEQQILDLNKVKVELVAAGEKEKAKQVRQEIERLNNSLKEQRLTVRATNTALREKNATLKESVVNLDRTTKATKNLSQAQQQFRKQAGASNNVALEFNRIIQDAPFGIIGVGNNLQQLGSNFALLRASAGGTGAAISAALTSIVSPVNLVLLGISALTSLWAAYQLGVFDSAEETDGFKKVLDALNESLDNYIKQLGAVATFQVNAAIASTQLAEEAKSLIGIVDDENRSLGERNAAYKLLQDLAPRILGNISSESALVGNLTKEYDLLIAALVERATFEAAKDELNEVISERIKLLRKEQAETTYQIKLFKERDEATAKLESAEKSLNEEIRRGGQGANFEAQAKGVEILKRALADIEDEINTFNLITGNTEDGVRKNTAAFDSLKTTLGAINLELVGLLDPLDKIPKGTKEVLDVFTDQRWQDAENMLNRLKGALEGVALSVEPAVPLDGFTPTDATPDSVDPAENAKRLAELKKQLDKTKAGIESLFSMEALGGNPFSFLVDSIFLLQETNKELDNFTGTTEEKMALLREQFVLTGNVFSGLGDTFASTFATGNASLQRFISSLGDFVGQVFVFAKAAQATKKAAELVVAAKQAEATAATVSAAAQTASSLGPASFWTLAPLIASGLALIGSVFSGIKGGKGGGSSAASAASANSTGSTFTGSGLGFTGFGDFDMTSVIKGTDIVLSIKRTEKANA